MEINSIANILSFKDIFNSILGGLILIVITYLASKAHKIYADDIQDIESKANDIINVMKSDISDQDYTSYFEFISFYIGILRRREVNFSLLTIAALIETLFMLFNFGRALTIYSKVIAVLMALLIISMVIVIIRTNIRASKLERATLHGLGHRAFNKAEHAESVQKTTE